MAVNQHLIERLKGIQQQLMGGHTGGGPASNATKGREREELIDLFLSKVMPPPYRFGTGDITDSDGQRSGQVDVVVEYPFLPSLPMVGSSPRLYLAEGVASVIEVKSDIATQWAEVEKTASAVRTLTRKISAVMHVGDAPNPKIPILAIGYKGWQSYQPLVDRIDKGSVDAILVIESGLFASKRGTASEQKGLWAFISVLHSSVSQLIATHNDPLSYII